MKFLSIFLALIPTLSIAEYMETHSIITPRGELIPVNLHLPDSNERVPLIIMAPGGGYHKDYAIFKLTAEKAVKLGIGVLRMNWGYCKVSPETGKCTGRWSDDLSNEIEDLNAVVNFAQNHQRVNSDRLILSGKSLGTLVSYEVFQKNPTAFYSLALLTPLCTSVDSQGNRVNISAESYPNFKSVSKPLLMLLGDRDPATDLQHLWELLAHNPSQKLSVSVVGGDHSMIIDSAFAADVEPNASNLNQAIDSLVAWVVRTVK